MKNLETTTIKTADQPTHPFKCVNNDCEQPQAAFSIYCPSCEAIALSNYFKTSPTGMDDTLRAERRSETVQVKVKPTEKDALRRMAIRDHRSVSDIVRDLIVLEMQEWIEQECIEDIWGPHMFPKQS